MPSTNCRRLRTTLSRRAPRLGSGKRLAPSATRCWTGWRACRRSSTTPASAPRKEQQDFRDYALVDTVKAIIPVLDSFERALRASPEKSEFHAGVELIYKQLQDALAKLGVRPIPAKGEPFDPRYHEAVEMVETTDAEDHHVLEELQRGYQLKDRLLRPAMVRVAKNPNR